MVWFSKKGQKGELQKEMFNKSALQLQCASSSFDDIFKGNAPFLLKKFRTNNFDVPLCFLVPVHGNEICCGDNNF